MPGLYFQRPTWNLYAYLGVLISVAALVFSFHVQFVYAAIFVLASVWYGAAANRLSAGGAMGVDAVMTSELIITCGIASLILHVAIAGFYIDDELANNRGFSEQTVRVAATVFSEGLVCAAFAPVIAVVFRFVEGHGDEATSPSPTPEDIAGVLDELAERAARLTLNMERLSLAIGDSAERYEGAAVRVTTALEALATDIQANGQSVSRQLSQLESRTRSFGDSVAQTSSDLRTVGSDASDAFGAIADGIKASGEQVDEFAVKVRAGGELLDGLSDLINSVNRFIRPDPDPKADPKTK